MIDINELREAIQTFGSQAINEGDLNELLNRLEAAETAWKVSDKACYDLTEKVIPNLRDQLVTSVKTRHALRAKIEQMENQEPPCGWWDDLIADISAIDCMYRGWPTYAHDAYWMRDRVVRMLEQRRDSTPAQKENDDDVATD